MDYCPPLLWNPGTTEEAAKKNTEAACHSLHKGQRQKPSTINCLWILAPPLGTQARPKTRPHLGWNRCAQNRCGLPMHQARGPEKHLPNQLVEDVARSTSLTDPLLKETDLFRSSVCFQVQRQGSRKRSLQTGWLKRGSKTRPHLGWNRCAQNRCGLPMHQARGLKKHLPNQLVENLPRALP